MKEYKHLVYQDRQKLETLYKGGEKVVNIAAALGVHRATVYLELKRGDTGTMDDNGRIGYSAELAQRRAYEIAREYREKRMTAQQ